MLAGGLLSLIHGVMTIHLRADQVVSGLALTFLGTGLARVLGEGLSSAGEVPQLPRPDDPGPVRDPAHRAGLLDRPERPRVRRLRARAGRLAVDRADPAGAPPPRRRRGTGGGRCAGDRRLPRRATPTCSSAGCWPAWPARRSRSRSHPGWFGDQTVNGRGWIAVGLVIFAQWSPLRAAFGAVLFGAIFRFILDIQGVRTDPRLREPVPGRPVGDVLPRDAALPDGHLRRRHRVARGGPQARRRARPRSAGRTCAVSAGA